MITILKNYPFPLNRLGEIVLLAASVGSVVGCGQKDVRDNVKVITTNEQKEVKKGDERMERFLQIAGELEARGAIVKWNHPAEGPKNPLFIVTSCHINQFGNGTQSPLQIEAIVSEYYELRFMMEKSGLQKFAFEGGPAGKDIGPAYVTHKKLPSGFIMGLIQKHDGKPPTLAEIDGTVLTPEQVRSVFADPKFLTWFVGAQSGNVTDIPSAFLSAGKEKNDSTSMKGAEPPDTFDAFDTWLKAQKNASQYYLEFFVAAYPPERKPGDKVSYTLDRQRGIVSIGNKSFEAEKLHHALLVGTGSTPEFKDWSAKREKFVADDLDADVVHFGNGHLPRFEQRQATRSIATVIPRGSIANQSAIDTKNDPTAVVLKELNDWKNENPKVP